MLDGTAEVREASWLHAARPSVEVAATRAAAVQVRLGIQRPSPFKGWTSASGQAVGNDRYSLGSMAAFLHQAVAVVVDAVAAHLCRAGVDRPVVVAAVVAPPHAVAVRVGAALAALAGHEGLQVGGTLLD